MKKVIVTGASGFIGRYIVKSLLLCGYAVTGFGRKTFQVNSDNFDFVVGDISCKEDVSRLFKKTDNCEYVVHLAANLDINGNDNTIITNCNGTYYLAKAAVENGVKCLINFSSIPVIGYPKRIPIDENHPVNPLSVYHSTKYDAECVAKCICSGKTRVLNYRISSPIGKGMSKNNFLSFLLSRCNANEQIEIYGEGRRIQNYIDVRDISKAVILGLESEEEGLFLIPGKNSIENIELAKLCIDLSKSNSGICYGKKEDVEENCKWIISGEKAKEKLSYEPQYGIADSINWILENGDRE